MVLSPLVSFFKKNNSPLVLIGDYKFELSKNNISHIRSTIEYKFSSIERVNNFKSYQDISKYEETKEIVSFTHKTQRAFLQDGSFLRQEYRISFVVVGK